MPAKGDKVPLESVTAYGQIILAILNMDNKVVSISKAVNKTHPTIIQQLKNLVRKGYVAKKQNGYEVNKEVLVKYWARRYKLNKEDQRLALEKFDVLLGFHKWLQFALPVIMSYKSVNVSIDELGKGFKDMIELKRNPKALDDFNRFFKMLSEFK